MPNIIAISEMTGGIGGSNHSTTFVSPITVEGGIYNGDFEIVPTFVTAQTQSNWIDGTLTGSSINNAYGWALTTGGTAGTCQYDSTVSKTGTSSLKIVFNSSSGYFFADSTLNAYGGILDQSIPILPNTSYTLTGYIKTSGQTGSTAAAIGIYTKTSTGSNVQNIYSSGITTNGDFTAQTVSFTTGATEVYLRIVAGYGLNSFAVNSGATCWIDTLVLQQTTSITNSGSSNALYYPTFTAVTSTNTIDKSADIGGSYSHTYTPPVTISESSINKCSFTPTKLNQYAVRVWPVAKGTGDWTITVHDASDNVIGTPYTIANASVTTGAFLSFINSWNWTSGAYHFHVTSTVADGTLKCNTASDLSSASYETYYSKNSNNFTVSDGTTTVTKNAPTTAGWNNGTIISFDSPLTLVPGSNSIYASSNGASTADGTHTASLQGTLAGSYVI
jgi:hypothetical protein